MDYVMLALSLGSIYALIALGYTMVYGIIKLINFAHGDVIMVGAYVAFFAVTTLKLSFIPALIVAMVFCGLLGVLMEKFAYKPLRAKNSSKITLLITAMGLSLLLQNTVRLEAVAGSNFRSFPSDSIINVKTYEFLGASISNVSLITIGVSLLLVVLLMLLVNYTKVGKAMRACSYDTDAAALMGINVNTIISITFAIGSALAAAAGLLYAVSYPRIDPAMGVYPGLKAFVAAVLGGIGILPGAMLGGFLIGIIETIAKIYASSYANAITFSILIVILLFRPTGLLGKKGNEKV